MAMSLALFRPDYLYRDQAEYESWLVYEGKEVLGRVTAILQAFLEREMEAEARALLALRLRRFPRSRQNAPRPSGSVGARARHGGNRRPPRVQRHGTRRVARRGIRLPLHVRRAIQLRLLRRVDPRVRLREGSRLGGTPLVPAEATRRTHQAHRLRGHGTEPFPFRDREVHEGIPPEIRGYVLRALRIDLRPALHDRPLLPAHQEEPREEPSN